MTRLWFLVPAHGRLQLSRICLRMLQQTCERVWDLGIEANAVVIADDENLELARELGFATVERDNEFLGRKMNDGYQLACDPEFNPEPADYVVPVGSDDWLDPVIFKSLPEGGRIGTFRQIAVVDEERKNLAQVRAPYVGGWGIRIVPREIVARAGYRPCEEDRNNALDSSAMRGFRIANGNRLPQVVELDVHPLQIVDWKSREKNLHPYRELAAWRKAPLEDPFDVLTGIYPDWALAQMKELC